MNRKEMYKLIEEKFAEYEDLIEEFAAIEGSLSKMINICDELLSIESIKDPFIDPIRIERIEGEFLNFDTDDECYEKEQEILEEWYGYTVDEMLDKMTDDELRAYLKYADELKGRFIESVSDEYEYDEEKKVFTKIEKYN